MWQRQRYQRKWFAKFFRIMYAGESLVNYYSSNFALCQHHGWDINTIEDMLPLERDIYLSMLQNFIEEENKRLENKANGA